jgi:hypothetical protein
MKIHISVITGQILANLLPLLADVPNKLLMLVSDDMQQTADKFEKTLNKYPQFQGMLVERINHLPDSSVTAITDFGLEVLTKLEEDDVDQIVYNVAGGTKLMALALSQVFTEDNITQIYPNTEHDEIQILWPADQPAIALTTLLNTKQHLEAHGVTWRSADSEQQTWLDNAQARKPLTFLLANQLAKDPLNTQKLVGMINKAGYDAQDKNKELVSPQQQLDFVNNKMHKLLKAYSQHELLDWHSDNHREIVFRSKGALRYATGGWLEEYFYLVAKQCELDDCHSGIKITDNFDRKADLRNELDGVIAFNNRLLLAESKTAALGKNAQKDSNIIYKLDSIARNIGGLYCTRILLSAVPLDHTTKQNKNVEITKRANATDIVVLDGANIIHLESFIKYWQQHGNGKHFVPGA